jgi:hypothetical protein
MVFFQRVAQVQPDKAITVATMALAHLAVEEEVRA